MRICPKCKHELDDGTKQCPYCKTWQYTPKSDIDQLKEILAIAIGIILMIVAYKLFLS